MKVLYTVTALLIVFCSITGILANGKEQKWKAKCVMKKGTGLVTVNGTIELEQDEGSTEVEVEVDIAGVAMSSGVTQHGFHVHAKGELTNECKDAGGHFNPHSKTHGGPMMPIRHVGDLGNINVTAAGTFEGKLKDSVISLVKDNPNRIIGLAIVVHAGRDDLGLGNAPDSNTTGAAGARIGCCKIELTQAPISRVGSLSACAGLIVAMIFFTFKA